MVTKSAPLFSLEMIVFRLIDRELHVYLMPDAMAGSGGREVIHGTVDLQADRNIDHSVKRLIEKQLGIEAPYIEQVKTIGNATRHPKGWMVAAVYYAVVRDEPGLLRDNWYPINRLSTIKLAYDHLALIYSCLKRMRDKTQYTTLPLHMMPEEFTLTELQQCYEGILSTSLEKKSFRRRILDASVLVALDKERRGKARPAQLFRMKRGHIIYHFSRKMLGSTKGG